MSHTRILFFIRNSECLSDITHRSGFATSSEIKTMRRLGYNSVRSPLTENGIQRAKHLGNLFFEKFFSTVSKELPFALPDNFRVQTYSSTAPRCSQTRELFLRNESAARLLENSKHGTSRLLRDRFPGVSFFMTKDEFTSQYPADHKALEVDKYSTIPPKGESVASREVDVSTFITSVTSNSHGNVILAFTSSGFMLALERLFGSSLFKPSELSSPDLSEIYILQVKVISNNRFTPTLFTKIRLQ